MLKSTSRGAKELQLTADQYREFSAKRFGAALHVSTEQAMGCWGQYSANARCTYVDATTSFNGQIGAAYASSR